MENFGELYCVLGTYSYNIGQDSPNDPSLISKRSLIIFSSTNGLYMDIIVNLSVS